MATLTQDDAHRTDTLKLGFTIDDAPDILDQHPSRHGRPLRPQRAVLVYDSGVIRSVTVSGPLLKAGGDPGLVTGEHLWGARYMSALNPRSLDLGDLPHWLAQPLHDLIATSPDVALYLQAPRTELTPRT